MYPPSPEEAQVEMAAFRLDVLPVTEGQYRDFVAAHPEWRRGHAPRVKADTGYLAHWISESEPGAGVDQQAPVTRVSWFAAKAYCAAQGRRLPTEAEWEFAAAASATSTNARQDPAYTQLLLSWYSRPTPARLPPVGAGEANLWGVHDLHGLVWEWVLDFNSTMVTGDAREAGDDDREAFCGAGAIGAGDPSDYASFMRYALRSSLQGSYTTPNLGFRCAADGGRP